jgi:hypothetical protein
VYPVSVCGYRLYPCGSRAFSTGQLLLVSLFFLRRPRGAEPLRTKHSIRMSMHDRGSESSETVLGALLAPRTSLQDRPSQRPKRARKHAAQHVLVTCKDTTNVLATFTPPRSAHQRRDPLTASARCARSPPPWLGFGHRWHTSSFSRGFGLRASPASCDAACSL